jgi:hypothetical protein
MERAYLIVGDQNDLIQGIVSQLIRAMVSVCAHRQGSCEGMRQVKKQNMAISCSHHQLPGLILTIVT